MRERLIFGSSALVFVCVILVGTLTAQRGTAPSLLRTDVSWPNCTASVQHLPGAIVGVTGGLDFRQNQCLRQEASWFSSVSLYMNTGWPGTSFHLQFPHSPQHCAGGNGVCLAYNYGFHAALYAIAYAKSQAVQSVWWWLDVETENSWTTDTLQNQAALEGMVDALQQNLPFVTVGFYSYPGQWQQIVGSWRPNFPAWVATGTDSKRAAEAACTAPSFTAGPVQLSQYTQILDMDYSCQPQALPTLYHF